MRVRGGGVDSGRRLVQVGGFDSGGVQVGGLVQVVCVGWFMWGGVSGRWVGSCVGGGGGVNQLGG